DRHRWVPDPDGSLYRLAVDAARQQAKAAADVAGRNGEDMWKWARSSESAKRIESTLKLARSVRPIADPGRGWDANPLLTGAENGVLNMASGGLQDGRAEDRITMSVGY